MRRKIFFSALLLGLFSALSYAGELNSPIGVWQTYNDKTGQPNSFVKITEKNGALVGQIMELLPGAHFKTGDVCSACPDGFKDQPIVGLQFLWDFVPEQNQWVNGKVLDPKNGHIYKGTLQVIDQGKKLELRGYWGPFWRTQTWARV
ncbi:MAG TPA: DUF2147 domain-containing protein [Gammaproteobacteria bacterium]|nr:DUF2147 domain-containing protein [Gammaproteobacteria bacterium]